MPIEARNLTYTYNPDTVFEKKALDDVSFTIQDKSFVGIIGHTGSGKSTLIQHLNALMKPTAGMVLVDGKDINNDKDNLKVLRQKVGLVFQYPEHQLFELTVTDDVAFGPKNMGLSKEEIKQRVTDSLHIVGISEDDFEKSPFELSGGQKRRVAIAGVLAMNPKVLILDEPTAGLDPRGREELFSIIKNMRTELDITIIMVSHSMEDIARLVDRILVLHEGTLRYDGTPKEVFVHAKELEEIGLAAPQSSYLLHKLKERGFDVPTDAFTIEETCDILYKLLK